MLEILQSGQVARFDRLGTFVTKWLIGLLGRRTFSSSFWLSGRLGHGNLSLWRIASNAIRWRKFRAKAGLEIGKMLAQIPCRTGLAESLSHVADVLIDKAAGP